MNKEDEKKLEELGNLIYSLIQDSQEAIKTMGKDLQSVKDKIGELEEKVNRIEFNQSGV